MDTLGAAQIESADSHQMGLMFDSARTCMEAGKSDSSRHQPVRIRGSPKNGRESAAVRRVRLAAGTAKSEVKTKSDQEDGDCEEDSKVIAESFRERALEEKCGVFGVISNGDWPTSLDVAQIICLGLVGLQHRGQESAGIVTCKSKGEQFNVVRSEGLVSSAFNEMSMMSLKGNLGIGHTRYSTTGGSGNLQLAQPFVVHTKYGTIAVAHNGELVNSKNLRDTLLSRGVGLTTGGDSELITQCLSQTPPEEYIHPKILRSAQSSSSSSSSSSGDKQQTPASTTDQNRGTPYYWKTDLTVEENNITSRILHLMSLTPVSYSLIVMYNECLYATRDCFGNRPLTIGLLVPPPNAGDLGSIEYNVVEDCFVEGWCISSESCPFPSVHAKLKRDVQPGEIIKFERNKQPKTLAIMPRPDQARSPAFCIFEYVYFARPDSILERQMVYAVRMRCGERLADESPVVAEGESKEGWIVAPVPESSIPAALGYSQRSQIPYVEVFCKNRYVGRTFIQPSTRLRRLGVAKKFGPLTENFAGKSIILIDDSIVRGTTIGQLVRVLREAGAKEVHIRIASPPLHYPCYMGINIPTKEELIANHLSPDHLALTLRAGSLKYLSVEGLRESVQSGIIENLLADKLRKVTLPKLGSTDLGGQNNNNNNSNGNGKTNQDGAVSDNQAKSRSGSFSGKLLAVNQDSSSLGSKQALETMDEELELKVGHCDACLTGNYPVKLEDQQF